jgi:hypothetical protein
MDNPAWISVPISILAVIISALSWWHNWSAYRDKRYGHIAALRSQLLRRLLKLIERLLDMEMALDIAEPKLRGLDEKTQRRIRHHSRAIEDFTTSQTETQQLWEIFERFKPETHNTTQHLRYLQSTAHTVALTEANTGQLERVARMRIKMIRAGAATNHLVPEWSAENEP